MSEQPSTSSVIATVPTLDDLVGILEQLDGARVAYQVRGGRLMIRQGLEIPESLKTLVESHRGVLANVCTPYKDICAKCKGLILSTLVTTPTGDVCRHPWCSERLPVREAKEKPARMPDPPKPPGTRALILQELRKKGVELRLVGEGMQYRDCEGVLSEEEKEGITLCSAGLAEQLRIEAGVCTLCMQGSAQWDSTWCIDCINEVGMQHYERIITQLSSRPTKSVKAKKDTASVGDLLPANAALEI